MHGKISLSRRVFVLFNTVFMVLMVLVCLIPFTHVLFASVSDPAFISQNRGLVLYPRGFNLVGYELVFKNPSVVTGYANTLFYTVGGTAFSLLLTAMGAYVLSRRNVLLNKFFMKMITVTMFFSGGLIPFFLVVDRLGLSNTRAAVIIPYALSTWNMIIMMTSFREIPVSLEESAKIDGANDFLVLFKIILPLSMPVVAVMILFYAIGYWNSWFPAVIFLRKRELFPLQLILREVLIQSDLSKMMKVADLEKSNDAYYRMLVKYTTIVIATLPVVFVYPFLQRYFIKGVMIGSIKE